MLFPRKCQICGMIRKNTMDRPCVNKKKISQAEKDTIEKNCPAAYMMYA